MSPVSHSSSKQPKLELVENVAMGVVGELLLLLLSATQRQKENLASLALEDW